MCSRLFWCSKVSDMVEDLHSVVSDEELYLKIEEIILAIPEVKGIYIGRSSAYRQGELLQHLAKRCIKGF